MIKKCVAEFLGTFALVLFGCGTAMLVGCDASSGSGYLLTALAFGLVVMAMAYSFGSVSGGHFNPAVTIGSVIAGNMDIMDAVGYIGSQFFGAFFASGVLSILFKQGSLEDKTGALGSNGLSGVGNNVFVGLAVEIILTCVFVLVILFITQKAEQAKIAGLIIGLTLTLIHIFGIGLTGTSVNPARSIGPALVASMSGVSALPLKQVWVFIVGPIIGAAIAAGIFRGFTKEKGSSKKVISE